MAVNPLQDVKGDLTDVTGSASAGAVTAVTGNAPITSSGGTTPAIGMTTPLGLNYGGTSADLSATGGAKNYVKQAGVGAALSVGTIASTDVGTGAVLADGTIPLTAAWPASVISGGSIGTVAPKPITAGNTTNWLNVVAYGADPTGATDSSAAVQKAITDACVTPYDVVYFPTGQYKLLSTMTVTSQISFRGDGPSSTTLTLPNALDGILITTITSTQGSVSFYDMRFNVAAATAGACIHTNSTGNFPLIVSNCFFIGHFIGIQMNTNWASWIGAGCQFASAVSGNTDILINNTINADNGDNTITGCTFWSNGSYNIRQQAGGGTRIINNKFVGPATYSIYMDGGSGTSTSVFIVEGNSLEGNVGTANMSFNPAGTWSNILVQGNEFEGTAGQTCVQVSPTVTGFILRGHFIGNTMYNAANHIVFNPGQAAGVNKWYIGENIFDSPTTAAITLPATANRVQNLLIAPNNFIQSGTAPYVSGAFDSTSGFRPGVETIFTQTANSVTTANTLTTLFGTGIGSLTIPAGRLMVGTQIRVRISGFCSTAQASGSAVYAIKLGGTTVATVTAPLAFVTTINYQWAAIATITCRSTGNTGTVVGSGSWQEPSTNTVGQYLAAASTAPVTVSTLGALVLDVLYNNATATGVLTTTEAVVEILN